MCAHGVRQRSGQCMRAQLVRSIRVLPSGVQVEEDGQNAGAV